MLIHSVMTPTESAVARFKEGFACSQAILEAFAPALGLERTLALKVAAGFGGGMGRTGGTCGAVTGAILVLGLRFGTTDLSDRTARETTYAKVAEFIREFEARHRTVVCRELLGCDIGTPQGLAEAREKGLFTTQCPHYVRDAAELLERWVASPAPG